MHPKHHFLQGVVSDDTFPELTGEIKEKLFIHLKIILIRAVAMEMHLLKTELVPGLSLKLAH